MKRLPLLRIIALNAIAGSIDLVLAVEGAYFVPAIYNLGLSPFYGAMLLSISPLISALFQGYLGSTTDQCTCRWGRRRPFILGFSIACLFGLLLFPFVEDIADLSGDHDSSRVILILLVIVTTFVTDFFGIGSVQVPFRAYALDVLPQKQVVMGNIAYSICLSLGSAAGFGIGAVNWASLFTSSDNFSLQVKFVFGLTFLISIICVTITLLSVPEQNPQLKNKPDMQRVELSSTNVAITADERPSLKSCTADDTNTCTAKDESSAINSVHPSSCHMIRASSNSSISSNVAISEGCKTAIEKSRCADDTNTCTAKDESSAIDSVHPISCHMVRASSNSSISSNVISEGCKTAVELEEASITASDQPPTSNNDNDEVVKKDCFSNFKASFIGNVRFLWFMSSSMIILCVCNFFALLALFSQLFFFTNYVAEVTFDGDVTAPENSTAYMRYTEGVQFGSLVLGVSAVVGLVVSVLLGPLIKLVGMRPLFVLALVMMMLESGVLIVSHSRVVVFVLSPAIALCNAALLTFPFILIAKYETKELLLRKPWPYADRILIGRACAILKSSTYIAQVIALIINGPLRDAYGSAVSVMIFTSAISFVGALVTCFVTVPPTSLGSKRKHMRKILNNGIAMNGNKDNCRLKSV